MDNSQPKENHMSPVVICMPSPSLFKITKDVPRRDDVNSIVDGKEEHIEEKPKEVINNDVIHITRSI